MKKKNKFLHCQLFLIGFVLIFTIGCHKKDNTEPAPAITVTDIDGNVYRTVSIGSQVWMAENLRVTHYRNGTIIPEVQDNTDWAHLTSGACCSYENSSMNLTTYGRLYNWFAVNDLRNLAPAGWHIPSVAEVNDLVNHYGGVDLAGGKLKESGTDHWGKEDGEATNESGFTALPGGYRIYDGASLWKGTTCAFWSSIEENDDNANCWTLALSSPKVYINSYFKVTGMSIRCVKN